MKNRNRTYSNGEITILWRAALCSHSTTCYRELRAVFDPSKRPWVDPKGASTEDIKKIIEKCPTQALTFLWNDTERNNSESSPKLYRGNLSQEFATATETSVEPPKINIRPNGPIILTGDYTLIAEDGSSPKTPAMMSLCRCGASRNMPNCDGTHFKIGFSD